jgi:hypothetical protein
MKTTSFIKNFIIVLQIKNFIYLLLKYSFQKNNEFQKVIMIFICRKIFEHKNKFILKNNL